MTQDAQNRISLQNSEQSDPLVGTVVNGRFRVLRVVATGGMGRIYQAEQLPLGRRVALKVLSQQYTRSADDEAFQKRFFLEASILSKLQHTNIVTVFDYGRIEGTSPESYFMVMEFLSGETLHERLARLGTLSASEVITLARQLARGLREAHRNNVVHRDLKPSNIMLLPQEDGSELVKVVDFGLLKVLTDDSDQVTKDGTFLGSPRYMSPEQIAHGKVDHRTDVYSLGVILYQCLCGQVPFDSEHAVQTLMAHLNTPVPPMRPRAPAGVQIPDLLEDYVMRCLAKSADDRPASMEAVVRELGDIQVALGLAAPVSGPSGVQRYDVDTGSLNRKELSQSSSGIIKGRVTVVTPDAERLGVQPMVEPTLATRDIAVSRTFPRWVPIVIGASVLAAGLALLWVVTLRPRAATPAALSAPAPAVSEHASYVLTIDSTPPAADVTENGAVLGKTPLQLTVNNAEVAREPRRLTVSAPGFLPFTIVQGASDQSVRVAAALVPVPTATATAEPVQPTATRTTQPRVPASPPLTTKKGETKTPDSDIRLQR